MRERQIAWNKPPQIERRSLSAMKGRKGLVITAVIIVAVLCAHSWACAFSAKIPEGVKRIVEEGENKNTDKQGRAPKSFSTAPTATETPTTGPSYVPPTSESPGTETPAGTGDPNIVTAPPAPPPDAPAAPGETPAETTSPPAHQETPAAAPPRRSNAGLFLTIVIITLLIIAALGLYMKKKGRI
jgi:flagellar basal body-associated protein FliL